MADTDADMTMWARLEAASEVTQGMFTAADVENAMRASNFNKGLGPDGFDGTILRQGDLSQRLTQEIAYPGAPQPAYEYTQVPLRGQAGAPVQEQGQGPS